MLQSSDSDSSSQGSRDGTGGAAKWDPFCKTLRDGRQCWQRKRYFFVDPFQMIERPLRNVVLCNEVVEVMAAMLKP